VRCDLALDPGHRLTVRIVGPDGKPVSGARVAGQIARSSFEKPQEAERTVYALTAGQPRLLLLQHEGKHLAGRLDLKGNEKGPLEVRLQASATLSGQLVDDEGRPFRHTDITVYYVEDGDLPTLCAHNPMSVLTDAEGRFQVASLVPGTRYVGHVRLKGKVFPGDAFDVSLKAGERRDLGSVRPKTRDR
jgi:hypothetical protein